MERQLLISVQHSAESVQPTAPVAAAAELVQTVTANASAFSVQQQPTLEASVPAHAYNCPHISCRQPAVLVKVFTALAASRPCFCRHLPAAAPPCCINGCAHGSFILLSQYINTVYVLFYIFLTYPIVSLQEVYELSRNIPRAFSNVHRLNMAVR